MNNLIGEIVGWYGMIAIVLAYALLSFNIISSSSIVYQLLNLTGAIGIVIISVIKKAYQPAALNTIWTLIAIVALLKIIL
jgi:hypothetical protein